jgi:hypothetical protein
VLRDFRASMDYKISLYIQMCRIIRLGTRDKNLANFLKVMKNILKDEVIKKFQNEK